MIRSLCSAVLLSVLFLASSAFASSGDLLNFQGLGDLQAVSNFYNGSGLGATPNYGVTFSPNFLGLRSYAQGGNGDFSPTPVLFTPAVFISNGMTGTVGAAITGVMNVAPGFSTGLNFFYTAGFAANQSETVTIWSGANGTGTVLATIALSNNNTGCSAPMYCNWSNAGLTFTGTAHSVTFTGPADEIGFSDVTLGSSTTAVPEPSTIFFLATGLVGMGIPRLRRFFRL